MKICLCIIMLGGVVMLYGAVTIYENEGRAFLSGCLIAAAGILLSLFFFV